MRLNIGCGGAKLENYINIDINPQVDPDTVLDITQGKWPYENESADHITMFHTLEHVARENHNFIFAEINRVLKTDEKVFISFPDAAKCVKFWLDNKWGMRESYWEKTICGRGASLWDCHRSLIYLDDFIPFLKELGFFHFKVREEVGQTHNAIVEAVKVFSVVERTELLKREVIDAR